MKIGVTFRVSVRSKCTTDTSPLAVAVPPPTRPCTLNPNNRPTPASPLDERSAVRQLAPAMLRIGQPVGPGANQELIINYVAAVGARKRVCAAVKLCDLDLWRDRPSALEPFDHDGTLNGHRSRRALRRVLRPRRRCLHDGRETHRHRGRSARQ